MTTRRACDGLSADERSKLLRHGRKSVEFETSSTKVPTFVATRFSRGCKSLKMWRAEGDDFGTFLGNFVAVLPQLVFLC